MFTTIRQWFRPKAKATASRAAFRFVVNDVVRYADPIASHRRLEENGGEVWATLLQVVNKLCQPPTEAEKTLLLTPKDWAARNTRRLEAIRELASISRRTFELPAITPNGQGVTEEEAIGILCDFLEFTRGLAEAARPFAN